MKRIQRKRTKGWKMPENAIYCGRPTKWGNPFSVEQYGAEKAVSYFRQCLGNPAMCYYHFDEIQASLEYDRFRWMQDNIQLLQGKDLACFCSLDKPCHCDVLIEWHERVKSVVFEAAQNIGWPSASNEKYEKVDFANNSKTILD